MTSACGSTLVKWIMEALTNLNADENGTTVFSFGTDKRATLGFTIISMLSERTTFSSKEGKNFKFSGYFDR